MDKEFFQGNIANDPGQPTYQPPQEKEEHKRKPWLTLLIFITLLGLIAWETGATFVQHNAAPTEDEWRTTAAKLRAVRNKGEPILFAPHWVSPLGQYHIGDQLTLKLSTLSDVDRFATVWQVSVRGAKHPWLEKQSPAKTWEFGNVTLQQFQKSPEKVLFDFTDRIRHAKVVRKGHKLTRCNWQGDRFNCNPSWNWVGPNLAEVGHKPYRCIYAHPVDGNVMRITYPSVRLGQKIVVYTGIDDFENRKRGKAPVMMALFVGGNKIHSFRHENQWDWHRTEIKTDKYAGKTYPVRFEITTELAYSRTFCFSAEARK